MQRSNVMIGYRFYLFPMEKLSKKEDTQTVAVIGLGYVGLTLATIFAEVGKKVVGVDQNETIVDMLSNGIAHFYEPGLEEKMLAFKDRLVFRTGIPQENSLCVYIISVGSNLSEMGEPDYSHIDTASIDIADKLKKGDLVILRSTVPIGTTRSRVIPNLEKYSGLIAGKDFFVAFAPERTIEGKALEELRTLPQLIGGYTKACRDKTEQLFSEISQHIVLFDTLEEAELSKLISNSYRDFSFAFANSIALIASEHNINIHTVISGANDGYKRNNIPLPSPGVGGYCLTKDPQLLAYGAKKYQLARDLIYAGRAVNALMPTHVADMIDEFTREVYKGEIPHIIIAGLAFKGAPATSDVRHSPSYELIELLQSRGYGKISGYDPHVSPDVFKDWRIGRIEELHEVPENGDIVILMHRSAHYENINFATAWAQQKNKLLVDPWGMYNHERAMMSAEDIVYANLSYNSKHDMYE